MHSSRLVPAAVLLIGAVTTTRAQLAAVPRRAVRNQLRTKIKQAISDADGKSLDPSSNEDGLTITDTYDYGNAYADYSNRPPPQLLRRPTWQRTLLSSSDVVGFGSNGRDRPSNFIEDFSLSFSMSLSQRGWEDYSMSMSFEYPQSMSFDFRPDVEVSCVMQSWSLSFSSCAQTFMFTCTFTDHISLVLFSFSLFLVHQSIFINPIESINHSAPSKTLLENSAYICITTATETTVMNS